MVWPSVGSASGGREILDHIIALNDEHLRRVMRDYVSYH
jgi:hypothetical protein